MVVGLVSTGWFLGLGLFVAPVAVVHLLSVWRALRSRSMLLSALMAAFNAGWSLAVGAIVRENRST